MNEKTGNLRNTQEKEESDETCGETSLLHGYSNRGKDELTSSFKKGKAKVTRGEIHKSRKLPVAKGIRICRKL